MSGAIWRTTAARLSGMVRSARSTRAGITKSSSGDASAIAASHFAGSLRMSASGSSPPGSAAIFSEGGFQRFKTLWLSLRLLCETTVLKTFQEDSRLLSVACCPAASGSSASTKSRASERSWAT